MLVLKISLGLTTIPNSMASSMHLSRSRRLNQGQMLPISHESLVFRNMKVKYSVPKISAEEITNKWHDYVKSGKSDMMGEIYENSKEIIYFAAYKILLNKALAFDTTQDVFEYLIINREKHGAVRNFYAWISVLSKRHAIKIHNNVVSFIAHTESQINFVVLKFSFFQKNN